MVTRLLALLILLPFMLFSAEFTSSVNRNEIRLGDSLVLTLTLKNASPNGNPLLDALRQSFYINSQQQAHNTVIINGQANSNILWKIVLIPQREGEITIPSIVIDTSEGLLSSKPLTIQVVKGNPKNSNSEAPPVILTSEVSNAHPYKNEPIIYTVKLISKHNLSNVKLEKLNVEDALTESIGEGKIYQKIIDGITTNVIEINYLITPLKIGKLKIPPMTIQGGIPVRNRSSLFDDDLSLFSMIQGFDRLKPFALTTEELILPIQAPIADLQPWIPAKNLHIEETSDNSQTLQVGNPIARSFYLTAEGIKSSQLPNLHDFQIENLPFKIYADKPELGEHIDENSIQSYRKEHYTLIPQQAGSFTLPEITLRWWDTIEKEIKTASIPARTLHVIPDTNVGNREVPFEQDLMGGSETQAVIIQRDPLLYGVIGGLAAILLIALIWGISLQRKIARIIETPTPPKLEIKKEKKELPQVKKPVKVPPKKPKDRNEKLPDLNPT